MSCVNIVNAWCFCWQVYDDTEEGRKVCTYYKLVTMPTTLVLDPLTGLKMRAWEGMIAPDRLLEVWRQWLSSCPKCPICLYEPVIHSSALENLQPGCVCVCVCAGPRPLFG